MAVSGKGVGGDGQGMSGGVVEWESVGVKDRPRTNCSEREEKHR